MIIVEGPDGGGKSSLCGKLAAELGVPVHERASHGVDGPVANLFDWAYRDVLTMAEQPISIYDRHPLISEYVYGPVVRGTLPDGFVTTTAHAMIRMMAGQSLVVLCRPSNERLRSSVSAQRDMPGVTERIDEIASAYDAVRMFWPGQIITYDYTALENHWSVLSRCRIHVAREQSKRIHPSSGR